jgi:hypothetical protein
MSFTATFVSIAAIVGAGVIVLTAVVGFGCYRFLRDLSVNRRGNWTPKVRLFSPEITREAHTALV